MFRYNGIKLFNIHRTFPFNQTHILPWGILTNYECFYPTVFIGNPKSLKSSLKLFNLFDAIMVCLVNPSTFPFIKIQKLNVYYIYFFISILICIMNICCALIYIVTYIIHSQINNLWLLDAELDPWHGLKGTLAYSLLHGAY